MEGEHGGTDLQWVERGEDYLALVIDTTLYPKEGIFRACYVYTDRCYLFVEPAGPNLVKVRFRKRRQSADLGRIAAEFGNELLNQSLRYAISAETRPIRELIVKQAFAEADFSGS